MISAYVDTTVQLGVNPQMDPRQAHGSASYRAGDGQMRTLLFQVDHPKRLKHPTDDTIQDMLGQLERLGYTVNALTIAIGRRANKVFRRKLSS